MPRTPRSEDVNHSLEYHLKLSQASILKRPHPFSFLPHPLLDQFDPTHTYSQSWLRLFICGQRPSLWSVAHRVSFYPAKNEEIVALRISMPPDRLSIRSYQKPPEAITSFENKRKCLITIIECSSLAQHRQGPHRRRLHRQGRRVPRAHLQD